MNIPQTVLAPGAPWPTFTPRPLAKRLHLPKLSAGQVLEIRTLAELKTPYKYLEVKYNVSRYTLHDVINHLGAYGPKQGEKA